MSKYTKLENLKWHSPDESLAKPLIEFYITESDIADLPTIEVSEDCISRKWIMSRIRSEYLKWLEDYDIDQILGDIEDAPSVVPHAKEGEWIDKGWKGDWQFETDGRGNCWHEYECPKCGFLIRGSKSSYCPHCGKRMKGAE